MRLDAQGNVADLYRRPDRASVETALADWYHHAGAFDVTETNRLAATLRAWEPELLAYFDTGLTNGPTSTYARSPHGSSRSSSQSH